MFKVLGIIIAFGIGVFISQEYLRTRDIQRLEIEKETKIELAKYEIEKIKAQTNMYYAQAKLNQSRDK
jgi:C4-dicarboxylate transporter